MALNKIEKAIEIKENQLEPHLWDNDKDLIKWKEAKKNLNNKINFSQTRTTFEKLFGWKSRSR